MKRRSIYNTGLVSQECQKQSFVRVAAKYRLEPFLTDLRMSLLERRFGCAKVIHDPILPVGVSVGTISANELLKLHLDITQIR